MEKISAVLLSILMVGCGGTAKHTQQSHSAAESSDSQDSREYYPKARHQERGVHTLAESLTNPAAKLMAITNTTVMTATGTTISGGTIVLKGGAIVAVGKDVEVPEGATIIDGTGRYVTPGLIDSHSHIGVYPAPATDSHQDGNEMVAPSTPHARARYGYWAQDPQITRARAGGVTTALILPGSANFIGGRGYTTIMSPGGVASERIFPGAPATLKMACGENPKRVYGNKGGPQTRMGLYAAFRDAYQKAAEYNVKLQTYARDHAAWERKKLSGESDDAAPNPPNKDLGLDTLAAVLRGEVLVQVHCYRAGDIRQLVEISDEFGFDIRSFHHASEAYKVRDILVAHNISISTWSEWWGFKMEAIDGIPENAALMSQAGGRAIIHSDSEFDIQHLNQEAAKGMYAGRAMGIDISENEALRWITANPAWALGIDTVTGTLETGKRADVVLWSGHPFSVYSLPDVVIQGGEPTYHRTKGRQPTDFELGNSAADSGSKL